jgi:thiol-disulfide isomerase/thioredoxin
VAARPPSKKLKIEATYLRARLRLKPISTKKEPDVSGVDEFVKLAPKDPRAGDLLAGAAVVATDLKSRRALLAQLAEAVPDSDLPGMLEEDHDPKTSIGKPFHLEFADAITGKTVAMRQLKGKLVVIVFWAASSDACVTAMSQWKELSTKYHSQGAEFIGVCLDQSESEAESGLESLKKFVKEKNVGWPQYYPGRGLDSSFAKAWSIKSFPQVFVVDAGGKLVSTDAGAELDKMIGDVLAGKKPEAGSAGTAAANP